MTDRNAPRMDPEHGIVWPVTLQLAGLPPEEIGVVPGGHGPERALDELALLLHEWADFITANRDGAITIGRAVEEESGVPFSFRKPGPDPTFAPMEASAVRAAIANWRRDHGERAT